MPRAPVIVAMVAIVAGAIGYFAFRDLSAASQQASTPISQVPSAQIANVDEPKYPLLAPGETLEWAAEKNANPVFRQAGPYTLEITRKEEDDLAAPVVHVSAQGQSVSFDGEMAQPGFTNRISAIFNRLGAAPVIMLQSFSGGAHCCNHVQLAGFSKGKLKIVDLGSWDGDEIELPKDVSGDGVTDFVMHDDRFLYAFASYADSYAPPRIFNVVDGKVIEVSSSPKFKRLFADELKKAGERCQPGNGNAANGACPSFVASAARVGLLDQAWSQMIAAYDPNTDWDLPTGCWVADANGCPDSQKIIYKSYPEALQAFLERAGYIPKGWQPPERRTDSDTGTASITDQTA